MTPSVVLSRPSPCNVPQGYASVADLPAALLGCHFEHRAGKRIAHGSEKSGELEPEAGRQDSAEPECLTPFFGNSLADSPKFRFE
jgi:hypothetical protein